MDPLEGLVEKIEKKFVEKKFLENTPQNELMIYVPFVYLKGFFDVASYSLDYPAETRQELKKYIDYIKSSSNSKITGIDMRGVPTNDLKGVIEVAEYTLNYPNGREKLNYYLNLIKPYTK
jgi:hypothetical protein